MWQVAGSEKKSSTKLKTLNPVWDEQFEFYGMTKAQVALPHMACTLPNMECILPNMAGGPPDAAYLEAVDWETAYPSQYGLNPSSYGMHPS